MYRVLSLFSLALLIGAGGLLQAQDTVNYPSKRVSLERDLSIAGFQAQAKYTGNRIIFRNVNVDSDGLDFGISGEIYTDFEIDEPPSGGDFQTGQMMGIKIKVELFEYPEPLKRKSGIVQLPKLAPTYFGNPVAGQSITVIVEDEDEYGLASFELPRLDKPLPPGVYRLIATISFNVQENKIKDGLKWCSSWYGKEVEIITYDDPVTQEKVNETTVEEVFGNEVLHDKHHKEILNNLRQIRDETVLYVGQLIENGNVKIRTQTKGEKLVNLVKWGKYIDVCDWVSVLQKQIDENPAYIKKQLEADLDKKAIKRIKAQNKGSMARANGDVKMYGGELSKAELKMFENANTGRTVVLEQTMQFEEVMTEKFWIFSDGTLLYDGYNTINHQGYVAYNACSNDDINNRKNARKAQMDKIRDGEGGLKGFKDRRAEAWKYYLPEIRKIAFKYLDKKLEKSDWDGKALCVKDGKDILLNEEHWDDMRNTWIADFLPTTDKMLEELDTSVNYAIRKWVLVWEDARDARNDCISLAFAWELHNLKLLQQSSVEEIVANWEELNEDADYDLSVYYKNAQTTPGIVVTRIKERLATIRSNTNQADYRSAYRRALDAKPNND
ncbi:MAG: hypothetical protein L3J82_02290 [Planctomycetes bacterium]|nr:hypothetical protein [Planctomycetota bacterium]